MQAVKKLDNSIYQFQILADQAKEIIRLKTKIYHKFKRKDLLPNEIDDQAHLKANDMQNPELNQLLSEYKLM